MGGNYSYLPSVQASNSFFCLTFRQPDRIAVIDCSNDTLELIRRAIARGYRLGVRTERSKFGAWNFVLAGNPFRAGSPKEEAIAGKQVACAILHDLLQRGWRATVSSELCRAKDLCSWFFVETEQPEYDSVICCVSLSGTDRLQLINFPKELRASMMQAVRSTWSLGTQGEFKEVYSGFELKMNGKPWSSSEKESVEARKLLVEIVRQMANQGYELYLSSSIKDTTDSLFFRQTNTKLTQSSIDNNSSIFALSLNRDDRIRLIEAPVEVGDLVRRLLQDRWSQGVERDRDYHGSREFKLGGSPWWTDGMDAVQSRLIITLLLQELRYFGWELLETVEICRSLNDKAVFLFRRCEPQQSLHWCLSLNETGVLRFINAPLEVVDALRLVIASNYIHGVKTEKIYSGYHQVRLSGRPWSAIRGNAHVHGKHLMLGVLEAMQQRGWGVVCSADVSSTYHHSDSGQDYPLDVHSLWFAALSSPESQSVWRSGGQEQQQVAEL